MGNTCKPMAVSFQCMTKFTTNKKIIIIKKEKKKSTLEKNNTEEACGILDSGERDTILNRMIRDSLIEKFMLSSVL